MNVPFESIKAAAHKISPQIIQLRRTFHTIPELELHNPATQAVILENLQRIGITKITLGKSLTSVIADIEGTAPASQPLRCIALRSDTDALPVTEETNYEFSSKNDGRMHGVSWCSI